MAHWLYKSEPEAWSWDAQVAEGDKGVFWEGVRNHAANNFMKAMAIGDRGLFYHSNEGKAVVGIVEVIKPWAPDPKDPAGKFGAVTIKAVKPVPKPVTLVAIKADPRLAEMVLVKNSRLSVQPVTDPEWAVVLALGGVAA